jgi:hypothetical protein
MTRPCKKNSPETTMHGCSDANSTETLCGIKLDPGEIDVLVGYTAICRHCFPKEAARGMGEIELIGSRQGEEPD